jgi:AcrR family transcriptional regulator
MASRATKSRPSPNRDGRRRNRDAQLMAVAIDVFWRKGYSAATIQDVADEVGVLKGSLYHYIESKEELLFRIFAGAYEEAESLMAEVAQLDRPPLEKLHVYLERHIEQIVTYPERTSLYFREWRHLTGDRLRIVIKKRSEYERFLRNLIISARRDGEIDDSISARYQTLFIIGAINYIAEWYKRSGRDSAKTIAQVHAALAINTLRATHPSRGLGAAKDQDGTESCDWPAGDVLN